MSLLEAGACALPTVATDVAGTREALIHGQTGFLASSGDPLDVPAAMHRMMHLTPEARAALGQNARTRVIEHFSLDGVLDRWEDLYRELLQKHCHPERAKSALSFRAN